MAKQPKNFSAESFIQSTEHGNASVGSTRHALSAMLKSMTSTAEAIDSINEIIKKFDEAAEANKKAAIEAENAAKIEKDAAEDKAKAEEEERQRQEGLSELAGVISSIGGVFGGNSSVAGTITNAISAGVQAGAKTNVVVGILTTLADIGGKVLAQMKQGVESAISLNEQIMPKINTRLEGLVLTAGENNQITDNFYSTFFSNSPTSPYYSIKDYLTNISSLTEQGIAYNVEDRAMLKTIGDKLVTTFDVLNPTLQSLVKIQQTDSTAAYMGSEKMLTNILNGMFQDTSYLNSEYDSNWAKLLNASSNLTSDQAVQFQFNVQKWLGALSSAGVSSTATGSIAEALGKIGSGDVSNLSTILALAASQSGTNLGSILTSGFTNASDVDSLMSALIAIIQGYSGESNVVKSQLASIFGLSQSDFSAINNLDAAKINTLSSLGTNYATSSSFLLDNLSSTLSDRIPISTMYKNALANAQLGWASQFINDENKFSTYFKSSLLFGKDISTILADIGTWGESSMDSVNGNGGNGSKSYLETLWDEVFTGSLQGRGLGELQNWLKSTYSVASERGTGFSLSDGLGVSSSSFYSAVTGDSDLKYFNKTGDTTTTSTDTTKSYDIQTLSEQLFSDKTAIGVRVKSFDDTALDKLIEKLSSSAFDTNGNGINDMADMLSIVRSWGN